MFDFFKKRRRERLRAAPFPPEWEGILERNFALYRLLPAEDRRELLGHIQVFLAEKQFEGCGGLEITDEIRVTIAAQACLLLCHRDADCYPGLHTILVYPNAYVARGIQRSREGIVSDGETVRLGEAWPRGPVVLSWDNVRADAADVRDGHNVVLHEFAHKLDEETGASEEVPDSERRSKYVAWARVLQAEYQQLQRDSRRGRPTVLDAYGATDPAEFFAVATEAFFERPLGLKAKHPELYEEMKEFYHQDPVRFFTPRRDH